MRTARELVVVLDQQIDHAAVPRAALMASLSKSAS